MPVDGIHGFQTADGFFQPFHHELNGIHAKTRRGVVHGIFGGMGRVFQHSGNVFRCALQHILPNDDHTDPGRPDVFLGAGIDQAKRLDVKRSAHKIRRHIGHQRCVLDVRISRPLCSLDGVVGCDVNIGRVLAVDDVFRYIAKGSVFG